MPDQEESVPVNRIPNNNPKWSTGIISVVVSLTTALATFYALATPQINALITQREMQKKGELDLQTESTKSAISIQAQMTSALVGGMQVTSNQINSLLNENRDLKERMNILEKDNTGCKQELLDCQKQLEVKPNFNLTEK